MKKHPIEIFSDWVTTGKDDGMEINHLASVTYMLDYSLKDFPFEMEFFESLLFEYFLVYQYRLYKKMVILHHIQQHRLFREIL